MLKKTISYTDFNGQEAKDTYYFHVNKPEITQLIANKGGDIDAYAEELIKGGSSKLGEAIQFIQDIILMSVGERSTDGKHFRKTKAFREDFENSIAYAELFEELLSKPESLGEFCKGVASSISVGDKASGSEANLTAVADPRLEESKKPATPEEVLRMLQDNPELLAKLGDSNTIQM